MFVYGYIINESYLYNASNINTRELQQMMKEEGVLEAAGIRQGGQMGYLQLMQILETTPVTRKGRKGLAVLIAAHMQNACGIPCGAFRIDGTRTVIGINAVMPWDSPEYSAQCCRNWPEGIGKDNFSAILEGAIKRILGNGRYRLEMHEIPETSIPVGMLVKSQEAKKTGRQMLTGTELVDTILAEVFGHEGEEGTPCP